MRTFFFLPSVSRSLIAPWSCPVPYNLTCLLTQAYLATPSVTGGNPQRKNGSRFQKVDGRSGRDRDCSQLKPSDLWKGSLLVLPRNAFFFVLFFSSANTWVGV